MMIVDCVLSRTCGSCDPLSWASPEHLRMMFIASLIASAAAAVFAAVLSRPLLAIPFVCSAGASYVSSWLVERYFTYHQAIERHSEVVRNLTTAQQAAERALEQSALQAAERETRNGELQRAVEKLEAESQKSFKLAETVIGRLQEENEQGRVQIAALKEHLGRLQEDNAEAEKITAGLQKHIEDMEEVNARLREENEGWKALQMRQEHFFEANRRHVKEVRNATAEMCQFGREGEALIKRIGEAGHETVLAELQAFNQGKKLLELRKSLEEVKGTV